MTVIAAVAAGNYTHSLDVSLLSQDLAANTSTLSYVYNIHRNVASGSGAWAGSPGRSFSVTIDGVGDTETKTFDFRVGADLTAVSGTIVITHAADGTRSVSGSFSGPSTYVSAGMPLGSGSGSMSLPRIPRGPKVEVAGAWQQSIAFAEVSGAWQQCLVYTESAGAWVLVA